MRSVVTDFIRKHPNYAYLVDELESEANYVEGSKWAEAQTKEKPERWLRIVVWRKLQSFAATFGDFRPSWETVRRGRAPDIEREPLTERSKTYEMAEPLLDDLLAKCEDDTDREIITRRARYETLEEIAAAMGITTGRVRCAVTNLELAI